MIVRKIKQCPKCGQWQPRRKYSTRVIKRAHCAKNGDFDNMSGNALCYAWFIWRKGYHGPASLGWFNTPAPTITQPTLI